MRNFSKKLTGAFRHIGEKLSTVPKFIHAHGILEYFIFTVIMYLVVDILTRRSFTEPFTFAVTSPVIFVFNFMIVAFTMSLSLISYHRYFFYMLNVVFWLTMSITDFVLTGMRANPFSAIDFEVVVTALDVIPKYIGWGGIILIIAAFCCAIALLVLLWKKCPKPSGFNRRRSVAASGICLAVLCAFVLGTSYTKYIPSELETPVKAYQDYGFPYCFFRSFVDRGVVSPDEYSEEQMARLTEKLGDEEEGNTADSLPNVIFLQLESFFDINKVIDLQLSENPIPVFTSLKSSFPSGKLSVNAIGGGTANTEFEVLCGMNLAHFGLLECPYTSILSKTPCQSLASVMQEAGFTSHAIHNHIATFYSRHLVYSNIGFNTFTSLEYIKNVETNMLGWAKDSLLTNEISSALASTEGHDFIFTVSVQPHGRYPNYETADDGDIQVLSYPYDDLVYEVEYYVNQLHETDAFLGELIAFLEDYDEDVVLVVYGDHLPTIGLEAENMFDGDVYSTEYAIWSNCGFECEGGDLQAYQLSAKLLKALGISGGEMFRIHNRLSDDENYESYMQFMEYDMLKGKNYALGKNTPKPSALTFGTQPIVVTSVNVYDDVMFVSGEGFTRDSHIFINDRCYDTVYVSDTLLLAKSVKAEAGTQVKVAQLCDGSTLLSATLPVTYYPNPPAAQHN